jgi:hypothetical protein
VFEVHPSPLPPAPPGCPFVTPLIAWDFVIYVGHRALAGVAAPRAPCVPAPGSSPRPCVRKKLLCHSGPRFLPLPHPPLSLERRVCYSLPTTTTRCRQGLVMDNSIVGCVNAVLVCVPSCLDPRLLAPSPSLKAPARQSLRLLRLPPHHRCVQLLW